MAAGSRLRPTEGGIDEGYVVRVQPQTRLVRASGIAVGSSDVHGGRRSAGLAASKSGLQDAFAHGQTINAGEVGEVAAGVVIAVQRFVRARKRILDQFPVLFCRRSLARPERREDPGADFLRAD